MSFDPGETTGFVVLSCNLGSLETKTKDSGTFHMWDDAEKIIHDNDPDVVVAEDFKLFPHTAKALSYSRMYSSEVLGVIDFLVSKRDQPLYRQPASHQTMIEFKSRGMSAHIISAMKHALYFIRWLSSK